MTFPVCRVEWNPGWRIIPSRFPPVNLFERVTDPSDLEAVIELECMTNPRLRDAVGDIRLVPPQDRISGPGTSVIMAAFTHLNPEGSRFATSSYGVFYAAYALETAIKETSYHRSRFMGATRQPPMELDMRAYVVTVSADMIDLRGCQKTHPGLYDPDSYAASQAIAGTLRAQGENGLVYNSVRHRGGECIAAFRPCVLSDCRQERHLCYVWDGRSISTYYEKKDFRTLVSLPVQA
ncbi:RES family NAD+ phosphorylase [Haematospirillum jordaniae]|uniref:RES domain-containing protein n=1 Tax=Haematospirillum jordaniae TaxID=1549855 RepID=A0A143DHW3_9PROT|nr:RES family NAD+ phosphorylase [Haematospirillum jordaniae]AMW35903.1 hypothetical protein AY555_11090 [Haematospirillum jordaniae]NKD45948.1 RES family NAD+ phosphorylase [Haematospirillum jordaniae]NKD58026.1 RES family NAD+ phosphorylase [Haematospirillum jordaniae]NKD60042.1 RES family NAD+ phosphorylase [Haematospirillum jordaniae]NKD68023.1 RES family NAD+ phosphorylase [Haematospirillum jordaniae]